GRGQRTGRAPRTGRRGIAGPDAGRPGRHRGPPRAPGDRRRRGAREVSGSLGGQGTARRDAGVRAFARAWERALNSAGLVPMCPSERTIVVTELAGQLAAALVAEPDDAARIAGRVGTGLVGYGYAAPEALGRTITLINTRLAGDLGLPAGQR